MKNSKIEKLPVKNNEAFEIDTVKEMNSDGISIQLERIVVIVVTVLDGMGEISILENEETDHVCTTGESQRYTLRI